MDDDVSFADMTVPLRSETAAVGKETIEMGRVRITTHVDERQELIRAALEHKDVVVEQTYGRGLERP